MDDLFINSPEKRLENEALAGQMYEREISKTKFGWLSNPQYVSCYNTYKTWIDKERVRQRAKLDLEDGKYFSQKAAETFFTQKITKEGRHNARSALKFMYMLFYLAKSEAKPISRNDLYRENPLIQSNLKTCNLKQANKLAKLERKGFDVQQKKLSTSIVSPDEISKVIKSSLSCDQKWKTYVPKILTMFSCLIRHCSTQCVTLGKLTIVNKNPDMDSFFPSDDEEFVIRTHPALCIISTELDQKKKGRVEDSMTERRIEVTGGFRSIRYEMCFVSLLAMSMMVQLNDANIGPNLHCKNIEGEEEEEDDFLILNDYLQEDDEPYEEETVVEEEDEEEKHVNSSLRMFKCFPSNRRTTAKLTGLAFDKAGVPRWEKETHFKKAGIEYATSNGLTINETDALAGTKNNTSDMRYRSQLPLALMRLLAGANQERKYGNGPRRANFPAPAGLQWSDPVIVETVFSEHRRWKNEQQSPEGDKGPAIKTLLDDVLPFWAKIILQDGVYWLKHHPRNEVVFFLRSLTFKNPNTQEEEAYEAWSARMLEGGVPSQRPAVPLEEVPASDEVMEVLGARLGRLEMLLLRLLENQQRGGTAQNVQEHDAARTMILGHLSERGNGDSSEREEEQTATEPLCLTANQYRSVVNLVAKREEHLHPDLDAKGYFKNSAANNNWSRIKKIYVRLKQVQDERKMSQEEAARVLDEEREGLGLNMNQYWQHLGSVQGTVSRKRQKTANENSNNDN
ncbi:predicted protein [Chaetoceros tenuissimus]|uniref:Uncharacterized protein n=1 Tax=Chaetoceros tenuissimus TaxID=426638 RepID=A0AAD3H1V0_9STRA|nr:predicted protein [Chaetoceros tenuissimus]